MESTKGRKNIVLWVVVCLFACLLTYIGGQRSIVEPMNFSKSSEE